MKLTCKSLLAGMLRYLTVTHIILTDYKTDFMLLIEERNNNISKYVALLFPNI